MTVTLHGLSWISVHGDVNTASTSHRKDFREMIVHLAPFHTSTLSLSPDEWYVIMSVGAGLSNLKATRVTNDKTVVSGVLSDHPSLRCEFTMHHTQTDSKGPDENIFCLRNLELFANE